MAQNRMFLALLHASGFPDLFRVVENGLCSLGKWMPPLWPCYSGPRGPILQGHLEGNGVPNPWNPSDVPHNRTPPAVHQDMWGAGSWGSPPPSLLPCPPSSGGLRPLQSDPQSTQGQRIGCKCSRNAWIVFGKILQSLTNISIPIRSLFLFLYLLNPY